MSINIDPSAGDSMCQSLDPLKSTTGSVHLFRVVLVVKHRDQWYQIIREANRCFGLGQWRSQAKVLRRLNRSEWTPNPVRVWFDVPNQEFASWIGIKYGVEIVSVT